MSGAVDIPTLETERLVLRPYRRSDFDAYAALIASARAVHMGGPHDGETAWAWFTNDIAAWTLVGVGCLAIEEDGALAGFVGIVHPPIFPAPECGWGLYDGFTGRGLATEAAGALLSHAWATTDLPSIVSHIASGNAASIRVAERLGAVPDPDAPLPEGWTSLTYRHTRPEAA